jgi:hypothetical protein
MPITSFQKSFQYLILLLLLAWLALVGTSTWRHTQETDQPPVHDAFTYYLKAHNFWANLTVPRASIRSTSNLLSGRPERC